MKHEPETQKHGHISGHTERRTSKRSAPEVNDKHRMIPLRRKMVIQRALLEAEPVPIPERNRRSKILAKVKNLKNLENPNHPPSTVK
jgi:hypothetical protein